MIKQRYNTITQTKLRY